MTNEKKIYTNGYKLNEDLKNGIIKKGETVFLDEREENKKQEWNLSDKEQVIQGASLFGITDVKKFIKKLKEAFDGNQYGIRSIVIDKLAGERLK